MSGCGTLPRADADLAPLLERLLAATDRTETAALRPAAAALRTEEQAGQRIGPYRLCARWAKAAWARCGWPSAPTAPSSGEVALKLPRAEWTDRGLAQRLAREREILASLNHPNIARLYDAGWSDDGRPYLALEYVEGEPIDAWCDAARGSTSPRGCGCSWRSCARWRMRTPTWWCTAI